MCATIRFLIVLSMCVVAAGPLCPLSDGKETPGPFVLVGEDGGAVSGVRVTVQGRTGSVVTGMDGSFRLWPEPVPPFRLVVLDEGGRLIGTVDVEPVGGVLARVLTLKPLSVESVSVVGDIAPVTRAPPAAAATTLTRTEKDEESPVRLIDLVEESPGAESRGSGQTAVPAIRGLAGGRTLILLDDSRVSAERRAGASATYLDPFTLESVEVVRGPGSVAYGSDAIGGVIHARTPVPSPGSYSGRFEVGGGTGVPYASAAGEANIPVGAGAMLFQVHQRSFDDYETPDGKEANSSARDGGFLIRAFTPVSGNRLVFGIQVDRALDVERPASTSGTDRTFYPREDSARFTMSLDLPGKFGFHRTEIRAFTGRYRLVTGRERAGQTVQDRWWRESDVEGRDASLRVVTERLLGSGNLRIGFDLSGRFSLHATETERIPDGEGGPVTIRDEVTVDSARRVDTGVFVEGESPVGGRGMTASAGIRGDLVSARNEGGYFGDLAMSEGAVSGYAALRYRPSGLPVEVTAQVARGFRAPRLSDLFYSGTTGRGRITGNPGLEPENSNQLDLSARADFGRTRIAIFGYLYRIRNLIERYRISEGEYGYRNRGEEEIRGLEVEAERQIASRLFVRAAASWSRGEILDDGADAADIPATGMRLALRYQWSDRMWYRLAWTLDARDDRPGEAEVTIPGYGVLDGAAGWAMPGNLELRLRLKNITDHRYQDGADERAPLAPGRTASLVLAGHF